MYYIIQTLHDYTYIIMPDAVKYDDNHYCIKMIVKEQERNLANIIYNYKVKRSVEILNTL